MRPCDVDDRTGFSLLVIGLAIGIGATLLFVTIRNEGQDINSRISALETANQNNVDDIKSAKSWGSQAIENSIKAHRRIDSIEVRLEKMEQAE